MKIERRKTKKVRVGNMFIGGDSPISVQSMLSVPIADYSANIRQAKILEDEGCEIIRLSIFDSNSVYLISKLKQHVKIPVVADIQFSYKQAIESVYAGTDAVRLNPGNIPFEGLKEVVRICRDREIPIRIGINGGSAHPYMMSNLDSKVDRLVEMANKSVKLFESMDFDRIVVSIKTSDVIETVRAYEKLSSICEYPLHIGISEAGTERSGLIRSCMGIGSLLLQGIGDTLRISLSADPVKEVRYGIKILQSLKLRKTGVQVIACPTCGRTTIDVERFANLLEQKLGNLNQDVKIAVMGCPVNGPGEAKDSDFCITGVNGKCLIFKGEKMLKKVSEEELIDEMMNLINTN